MGKKAIVLAANGVEESELVITVDVLRRAEVSRVEVTHWDRNWKCDLSETIFVLF